MRRQTRRADPSSVRSWNEFAAIDALRASSPQKIAELAGATGLTPASLGLVMRSLEGKGWVSASQQSTNTRGRPALFYGLRFPRGAILGLDVGAHAVRAVLMSLDGTVIARGEHRVGEGPGEGDRLAPVADLVRSVLGGTAVSDVWLCVLAVGGHLAEDGTIIRSVAIPEWEKTRPAEVFGELLGTKVKVVNDVRASTWAEHTVGVAQDYRDVLLVHLGRRPTLGILLGGQPRMGAHGTAGDMSRLDLLPTETQMGWLAPFQDQEDPLGSAVRSALQGDRDALEGAQRYVQDIAPALAIAAVVVDPEVVVISGALAPLSAHFTDIIDDALDTHLHQRPALLTSGLDQFSTALGAALAGIRDVLDSLASPTLGVAPLTREEYLRLATRTLDAVPGDVTAAREHVPDVDDTSPTAAP